MTLCPVTLCLAVTRPSPVNAADDPAAATPSFVLSSVRSEALPSSLGPPSQEPPTDTPAETVLSEASARRPSLGDRAPAAKPRITPPKALRVEVPYPADAPAGHEPLDVTVKLRVGADGSVRAVRLVTTAGPPFDQALLLAATRFRFEPARLGHEPIAVEITYTQRFIAPPPVDADGDAVGLGTGILRGLVIELGTGDPLAGAQVVAKVDGNAYATMTDADGRFKLVLPEGPAALRIVASGYEAFRQREHVVAAEQVVLKYGMLRSSYADYETVVVGKRARIEVDRKSLRGPEIQQLPGTFGDPFRVVTILPGVSTVMGLAPFPVVRGSNPGSTAFMLDGVRLPMLFHLLALPAVIHPELVDRVDFHAGGYRAEYGGATGGLVNGVTRRASADEHRYEADLNLLQTGLFVRRGFEDHGIAATVAGRWGYPGIVLSLLDERTSLNYWDYQARLDGGGGRLAWTVSVFGARDHLSLLALEENDEDGGTAVDLAPGGGAEQDVLFMTEFHRVDLRAEHRVGAVRGDYRLILGHDETIVDALDGDTLRVRTRLVEPRLRWRWDLSSIARLHTGIEASAQPSVFRLNLLEAQDDKSAPKGFLASGGAAATLPTGDGTLSLDGGTLYRTGLFAELQWEPLAGLLLIPGVRADTFLHSEKRVASVDPRLSVRARVLDGAEGTSGTWLKAATGVYHQPPRLFIPVPGISDSLLDRGLERALHCVVGLEHDLSAGLNLDVQVYYNHLSPIFLDVPGLASDGGDSPYADAPSSRPGEMPGNDPAGAVEAESQDDLLGRFDRPLETLSSARGRSYGVELMLRRRRVGRWFGWLAYTLSRSERRRESAWQVFDYDRLHVLNAVLGLRFPRNWSLGLRVLAQAGTPVTSVLGVARGGRTPSQWRADVRIDKRAIWNEWMLDFYVDVINVTLAAESGGIVGDSPFRYVLPTVGFRAVL